MKKILSFITLVVVGFLTNISVAAKENIALDFFEHNNVYYVTDRDNPDENNLESLFQRIENSYGKNIQKNYWGEEFYNRFILEEYELMNHVKSIFVFELTKGINKKWDHNGEFFLDKLYCFFKQLKTKDNYIMFISATEEARYESKNAFLDYVDFHIITNELDTIIFNSFYQLEQLFGNPPSCFDLIYNNAFIRMVGGLDNFKYYYLLPYINLKYKNDLIGNTQATRLYNNGINIYIEEELYQYNYLNDSCSTLYGLPEFILNPNLFVVGASESGFDSQSNSELWLEMILEYDPLFLLYINRLEDFSPDLEVFRKAVPKKIFFDEEKENKFEEMIYEFIINYPNSNDCKCYDNWTGRCVITHMMVDTSPYGGFYNIFDLDFINCWDMYAFDEDAEFNISYDDGSLL